MCRWFVQQVCRWFTVYLLPFDARCASHLLVKQVIDEWGHCYTFWQFSHLTRWILSSSHVVYFLFMQSCLFFPSSKYHVCKVTMFNGLTYEVSIADKILSTSMGDQDVVITLCWPAGYECNIEHSLATNNFYIYDSFVLDL